MVTTAESLVMFSRILEVGLLKFQNAASTQQVSEHHPFGVLVWWLQVADKYCYKWT